MKNLRTSMLCACLILSSFFAVAQDLKKIPINDPDHNKPRLFDNLPARISFDPETFLGLATKQAGTMISTSLSKDASIAFEGRMASSGPAEDGRIQSIVIQSTNYPGATLTMSRVVNTDGTVSYTGRLLSFKHGDLFVLQQTNGRYELVKKNFYDLVNE